MSFLTYESEVHMGKQNETILGMMLLSLNPLTPI